MRHVLSGVSLLRRFPRQHPAHSPDRLAILGLAATDLVVDAGMITYMQTT